MIRYRAPYHRYQIILYFWTILLFNLKLENIVDAFLEQTVIWTYSYLIINHNFVSTVLFSEQGYAYCPPDHHNIPDIGCLILADSNVFSFGSAACESYQMEFFFPDGKTALEKVMNYLQENGLREYTRCCNHKKVVV